MISLWDVLKASKGLPVSDLYAAMWGRKMAVKYTVTELEGTLPMSIVSAGKPLMDYRIYGNTEQTGTPTPENPIMPSGCGERTENLWDGSPESLIKRATNTSGTVVNTMVISAPGTYTARCFIKLDSDAAYCYARMYNISNNTYGQIVYLSTPQSSSIPLQTITATVDADNIMLIYDALGVGDFANTVSKFDKVQLCIIKSSTAPTSYIPYGYKLPLTSAGQNVDIYLGEVQTTRRIKKLVLTGEENYYKYIYSGSNGIEVSNVLDANYTRVKGFCSHYPVYPYVISGNYSLWIGVNNKSLFFVGILDVLGISTIDEFKSFLAVQYAAGTPVTVWYILTTPTTGIVNEPIRKIGDYADTVSMEQAGVSIPTNKGSTVIDYDGTPKPSQMYIKYLGR